MGTHRNQHLKRNNLFLLRVWAEDASYGDGTFDDGSRNVGWHGRLQRVVDGESSDFDDLQQLADVLEAMLSARHANSVQVTPLIDEQTT